MARADWGGGGDLSGLFASLIDSYESRVEAATKREIAKADQEQAVEDQEKYDQWKNGLIDDEEWLDYIQSRVKATKKDVDKTDHEKWVTMLREHTAAIRTSQMEQSYEEGSISIHRLIAYYKNQMEDVNKKSPQYRDLSQRYYDLLDTRDSDDIYTEAEKIIDGIERGTASYRDLRAFYQSKLKVIRKNSDLYKQVTREIDSIDDIIDGVTGGAGGVGGGSRRSGGSSGKGISAQDASQINALIRSRAKGGSLLYPGGEDPIASISDMLKTPGRDDYIDALKADTTRIQDMVEQYENNPQLEFITDNLTGQQYRVTPEFVRQLDNMYLRTEDTIWALYWQDGDSYNAGQALHYAQSFITGHMQKHNSIQMDDSWKEMMNHSFTALQAAAAEPDPQTRINLFKQVAQNLKRFELNVNNYITPKARNLVEGADAEGSPQGARPENFAKKRKGLADLTDQGMQEDMAFASAFADIMLDDDMDVAAREDALSNLIDQRPEGFYLTESELERLIVGKSQDDVAKMAPGLLDAYAARDGILDGTWGYAASGGIIQAMPIEAIQQQKAQLEQSGESMAIVFEKVGNRNVPVARATDATQAYSVYVDKDGHLVTASQLKTQTPSGIAGLIQSGQWTVQTVASWPVVVTSDGVRWFQDPATKLWYKNSPPYKIRLTDQGTIMVDDNGLMAYDVLPQASESGVIAPFAGMTPKDAQDVAEDAIDQGLIDLDQVWSRDENGNSAFVHPEVSGMYWSPADDAMQANNQDFLNDIARKRGLTAAREDPTKPVNWEVRQEAKRRAAVQSFLDEHYTGQEQMMMRKKDPGFDPLSATTQQMQSWARAIGVSITGNEIDDLRVQQQELREAKFEAERKPTIEGKLPPIKMAPLGVRKSEKADMPALPAPRARTGQNLAPDLPPPPRPNRPNLVEGADIAPAPPRRKKKRNAAAEPVTATGRRGGMLQ